MANRVEAIRRAAETRAEKIRRTAERNARSRARRARLKSAGLCINGPEHGKATHGVLCATCREAHRK